MFLAPHKVPKFSDFLQNTQIFVKISEKVTFAVKFRSYLRIDTNNIHIFDPPEVYLRCEVRSATSGRRGA